MWLRVKVNGHGECMINFDHVQKITPASNDAKRCYVSFDKGHVIFLDEPYDDLTRRVETYGIVTMEAAEAPLDVRLPPA